MKKLNKTVVNRLLLALFAAVTSLGFASCNNCSQEPRTRVVYIQARPRAAPGYTQSNEWLNGQPVRKVRSADSRYDDGVSEWRGEWVEDYGRQVAYGNGYRNAGGQYYCQPAPRPVCRQPVYRQPVRYCPPAPACGSSYGYGSGYQYSLPPPPVYQYHSDPSGGRNPNWRNPYSGYAPYSRPSPYGGVRF